MPVEVVAYMLSDQNINRRLQFQLILQCVPLLKGIKVACITNLERRHCRMLGGILKGTGITYRMLAVREERCLVILFREKEMERYLMGKEIREFLKEFGYVLTEENDGHVCEPYPDLGYSGAWQRGLAKLPGKTCVFRMKSAFFLITRSRM